MKRVRVLAFLITVCMATTCLLGGTIARYQTSASIDDAATAARWGVTLTAEGSLFGKYYLNGSNGPTSNTDDDAISVKVADDHHDAGGDLVNLVAPGTKGNTITITLTGTPEVDTLTTVVKSDVKDVYLKTGTYAVMAPATGINESNFADKKAELYTKSGTTYTKVAAEATFVGDYYIIQDIAELTADYYPIIYTVNEGKTNKQQFGSLELVKNDLIDKLNGGNNDFKLAANKNLADLLGNDGVYTLTWEWKIVNDQSYASNADTILGQLAAGVEVVKTDNSGATYTAIQTADYSLNASFDVEIKVEQED